MKHLSDRDGRAGRALRTLLVIVLTAAVVAPVAAFASNQFSDVPNGHTFHDDITWLADNDVTAGCNPPDNTRFCPGDDVTREQMAAFMRRLATKRVVDAGTLDGLDSGAFARSDQACASGDVVTGVAADGTVTCAADNASGGDADTLDGLDSTDLQRSGCFRGNVLAQGFVDVSFVHPFFATDGLRHSFNCVGLEPEVKQNAAGDFQIRIGDVPGSPDAPCDPQHVQATLTEGPGEITASTTDVGGFPPTECHVRVLTYDSSGDAQDLDFHFAVLRFSSGI